MDSRPEMLSIKDKISLIRQGVALLSGLIACGLGAVLWHLIANPLLSDIMHRVRWSDCLFLLPAAAYGLLTIASLGMLRHLFPILIISLLCFLPFICGSFRTHPAAGLISTAVLLLPWLLLYRLLRYSHEISLRSDPK